MNEYDKALINVLERIAMSFEQLVDLLPKAPVKSLRQCSTAFPWNQMSARTNRAARYFDAPNGMLFPFSCEDLVAIGREAFLEARNFGDKCADEIAEELDRMGFSQWNAITRVKKPVSFIRPAVVYSTIPKEKTDGATLRIDWCQSATRHVNQHGEKWRQCAKPAVCDGLCRTHAEMKLQKGMVAFSEFTKADT